MLIRSMAYTIHRPGPPLSDLVDWFWLSDSPAAPAQKERVLPTGAVDLIIGLGDDPFPFYDSDTLAPLESIEGPLVAGARVGSLVLGAEGNTAAMGVHFKPGGAFPFLGVPAGDLEGACIPLNALWGSRAHALHHRLIEVPSENRFRLLESLLLESARRPLQRHPALVAALQQLEHPDLRSIADVNARLGMSPKRLIALFRDHVGIVPKAFWRISRFHAALRHIERRDPLRGAELAVDLGYYDQAHFNREFRAFTQLSPRAYRALDIARPNHVPIASPKPVHTTAAK